MLRERRDPITLPEDDDIEAVLKESTERFGCLIRAALLTGCRQSGLTTLMWRDFNAIAETINVTGKGNKRRVLRLSADAADLFQAISKMGIPNGTSQYIFCDGDGKPFLNASSDFPHIRRRAMRRPENERLIPFRFHDLRHAFAVRALRAGMPIYDLSRYLGHTSVKTTEIYLSSLTIEEASRSLGLSVIVGQSHNNLIY